MFLLVPAYPGCPRSKAVVVVVVLVLVVIIVKFPQGHRMKFAVDSALLAMLFVYSV